MPSLPGVDEKAIAKGHSYMTLVCDLQAARVEYIGEERRKSSLAAYFQAFPQQRRQQIEVIRFHIMRHVLEAVDRVRKREHKRLMSQGDTTLAKSKYLWLYSEEKCAAAMQSVPCYRLPLWASRMQLTFRILAIA